VIPTPLCIILFSLFLHEILSPWPRRLRAGEGASLNNRRREKITGDVSESLWGGGGGVMMNYIYWNEL
jgi:hypothetical protein